MTYIFIFTSLIFYTTGAFCQDTPPPPQFIGKKTGVEISKAQPEDITPQNYPDIIKSFIFPNAELKDVIRAMSTDLNVNIIMDPTVGGNQKISIISYSPITVAEAYQAFLSALAIHGLTVVRTGSFLKVIKKEDALKSNLKVYKGTKKVNNDQFLTSIIKLKHVDAASLEQKMKPFIDAKSATSIIFYPPSNTVIVSDYGLNVNRIRKIIQHLDVPSQDFIFKVFRIKHARAETLTKIIEKLLISKGKYSSYSYTKSYNKQSSRANQFVNISSLSHDERTNSIILMSNQAGINKVKELIQQLDYYKNPELAGGIYVYKVNHGTAEELAGTLNELIGGSPTSSKGKERRNIPKIAQPSVSSSRPSSLKDLQNISTAQSFQDVRIIAEKNTNSLLIVSNKYNYETILGILNKVDISRNQVFVKSIIMELSAERSNEWKMANYFFPKEGGGISRIGYGLSNLADMTSTTGGATLFFPLSLFFDLGLGVSRTDKTDISKFVNLNIDSTLRETGGKKLEIPTLSSFVKFLQKTVGANILSTPQVMALDHQEATVSITEQIPDLGEKTIGQSAINQFTTSTRRVDVETALIITPHINPDVNSIRLKIEQKIDNVFKDASVPEALQKTNVAIKKRSIKTFITLKDKETAVLGGLIREINSTTNSKIPILGDLPIIGWLFKNSNTDRKKSNLIVFITPHIIRSAEEHKSILSSKLKERMNFIRQFTGNEDPYKELTEQMLNQQEDTVIDNSSPQEEWKHTPTDEHIEPTFEEQSTGTEEIPTPEEQNTDTEEMPNSQENTDETEYYDESSSKENENNVNEPFTEDSGSSLPLSKEEDDTEMIPSEKTTEENEEMIENLKSDEPPL